MSSDADYEAFLNKANEDTSTAKSSSKPVTKNATTKPVNTEVPGRLKDVDVYYVSDVDEPFEPVSLKWDKKTPPSTDELQKLLNHSDKVEEVKASDFDPRGHYKEIFTAIKESISETQDAKIFRVTHGSTRAEYYVVALDVAKQRIIGLKAKAVES